MAETTRAKSPVNNNSSHNSAAVKAVESGEAAMCDALPLASANKGSAWHVGGCCRFYYIIPSRLQANIGCHCFGGEAHNFTDRGYCASSYEFSNKATQGYTPYTRD